MAVPTIMGTSLSGDARMAAVVQERAAELGFSHYACASWVVEPGEYTDTAVASQRWAGGAIEALHEYLDRETKNVEGLGWASTSPDGTGTFQGVGDSPIKAQAALSNLRDLYKRVRRTEEQRVPVLFWTYGPHGARSTRRELDVPTWEEIRGNYPADQLDPLDHLMHRFIPGQGGQLMLWNGAPGTGKTTALRALGWQWREWCDLHYIVDPDAFFGSRADYMLDVMTRNSDVDIYEEPSDTDAPVPRRDRWNLLILEDAGELLQVDARKEVGQALSRFLNVVDGMIGQGLRTLVLVTTNEALGDLHPAVSRPGRRASHVEFDKLSVQEAQAWAIEHGADSDEVTGPRTLAEMYGLVEGFQEAQKREPVGFAI